LVAPSLCLIKRDAINKSASEMKIIEKSKVKKPNPQSC